MQAEYPFFHKMAVRMACTSFVFFMISPPDFDQALGVFLNTVVLERLAVGLKIKKVQQTVITTK